MLGSAHWGLSPIWKCQGPERSTVPFPSPSIMTMEGIGEVCACAKRRGKPRSNSTRGKVTNLRRMRIWRALYDRPVGGRFHRPSSRSGNARNMCRPPWGSYDSGPTPRWSPWLACSESSHGARRTSGYCQTPPGVINLSCEHSLRRSHRILGRLFGAVVTHVAFRAVRLAASCSRGPLRVWTRLDISKRNNSSQGHWEPGSIWANFLRRASGGFWDAALCSFR